MENHEHKQIKHDKEEQEMFFNFNINMLMNVVKVSNHGYILPQARQT